VRVGFTRFNPRGYITLTRALEGASTVATTGLGGSSLIIISVGVNMQVKNIKLQRIEETCTRNFRGDVTLTRALEGTSTVVTKGSRILISLRVKHASRVRVESPPGVYSKPRFGPILDSTAVLKQVYTSKHFHPEKRTSRWVRVHPKSSCTSRSLGEVASSSSG